MKTIVLRTFTTALLSLVAVSCSPIVAEYTYSGNVHCTGSGTSTRTLILKEYKDGKVSGQLLTRGAADPYSCGTVGGTIQGRSLTLYRSNLGSNYLAASMASGSAIATYNGTLSGNKRKLRGNWQASNRFKRGSFNFSLTHFNGKPIKQSTGGEKVGPGKTEPDEGIEIGNDEATVAPPSEDQGLEI